MPYGITQNGKTYTGAQASEYIKKKVRGTIKNSPEGRLGLLRVDNLEIDGAMANAVLQGGGTP